MGLCHPHGIMEWWSIGIVGIKSGNKGFIVFLPLSPSFHYFNIPVAAKPVFLCNK
jgi:hypothetical protein